ncbi:MAG TPA: YciI family protein [Fimbriimonadaceae bacterium]|nr:YciI family protein [Fimbriimonadaceae bacterium]HRJ33077.1 YciI family protein [Fimbriimonadaceae bacterium]
MQFLCLLRPTRLEMVTEGPTEDEAAVIGAHFEYLQGLVAQRVMLVVGRTQNNDEKTLGLAIFEAENEPAAQEIVRSDPAVAQGMMSAEVFPYRIALWCDAGPAQDA